MTSAPDTMVEGGFTPAPWIVHPLMAWVSAAADPDGLPVCQLCMESDGVDRETEAEANARLIAAAPEGHEANQLFLNAMDRFGNWDDGCFYYNGTAAPELQRAIDIARGAVAKARGEQS